MEIVIGLIGAKGAGKTTAYEIIQSELDVQEITLASKLKDVSALVTGVPRDWFDLHQYKEVDLETPVFLTVPLVEAIWNAYGISPRAADGFFDTFTRPHIGKVLLTPRQIAQYVGTEILRAYEPEIHCIEAAKAIMKRVGVVTDMRFPNEYDFFANNYPKFFAVYIHNQGAEMKAARDPHPSEAHIAQLAKRSHVEIINDGSIKDFQERVRNYVKETFGA